MIPNGPGRLPHARPVRAPSVGRVVPACFDLASETAPEIGLSAKVYRLDGVIVPGFAGFVPPQIRYMSAGRQGLVARGRARGGAGPAACVTIGAAVSHGDFGLTWLTFDGPPRRIAPICGFSARGERTCALSRAVEWPGAVRADGEDRAGCDGGAACRDWLIKRNAILLGGPLPAFLRAGNLGRLRSVLPVSGRRTGHRRQRPPRHRRSRHPYHHRLGPRRHQHRCHRQRTRHHPRRLPPPAPGPTRTWGHLPDDLRRRSTRIRGARSLSWRPGRGICAA